MDTGFLTQLKQGWHVVGSWLLVLFLVALLGFSFRELSLTLQFQNALRPEIRALTVAGMIYMAGHVLRATRLAIILGQPGLSLRQILCLHFYTSATNLLLPWKLGDIYRIAELSRLTGRLPNPFLAVWIERFFDIGIFLLLAIVVLSADNSVLIGIYPIVRLSLLFVVASFLIFVLLPENLNALLLFVLRRYRGDRAVQSQRLILKLQLFFARAAVKLKSHVATLCTLSALIWGCELSAFSVALSAEHPLLDSMRRMLLYLATISSSRIPEIFNLGDMPPAEGSLFSYLIATRLPLLIAALICGTIYRCKLKRRIPTS